MTMTPRPPLHHHVQAILARPALRQLVRFGIIGLLQNGVAYAVYLLFTWIGFDPKLVVGITYPLAMLVSFLGNRKYTFAHKGSMRGAGARFLLAHAASYALNLGMLYLLVDKMGYPHQFVQLGAIFICAAFLFITLKFFVFRSPALRTAQ